MGYLFVFLSSVMKKKSLVEEQAQLVVKYFFFFNSQNESFLLFLFFNRGTHLSFPETKFVINFLLSFSLSFPGTKDYQNWMNKKMRGWQGMRAELNLKRHYLLSKEEKSIPKFNESVPFLSSFSVVFVYTLSILLISSVKDNVLTKVVVNRI